MRTLRTRLLVLERRSAPAISRSIHEMTDAQLEAIIRAAGVDPNDQVQLLALANLGATA